ncbi:hypothetical protein D3C80_987220 [compost metagenome]
MAWLLALILTLPAGVSRNVFNNVSSLSIWSKLTLTVCLKRSPASVGEMLRVVRFNNKMPKRSSRPRMLWLSADCETPSLPAALVKLPSRVTMRKACRSL